MFHGGGGGDEWWRGVGGGKIYTLLSVTSQNMYSRACSSMGQVSKPHPPPPPPEIFGDNDFWIAQYVSFQYLLVCKMNYSAFRDYLRWYVAA